MAKCRVTYEYLLESLFSFDGEDLDLEGIELDAEKGIVILSISGPAVPDCDEVSATVTSSRRIYTFVPI